MADKKEKVVPPSPPVIIRDKLQGHQYKRVGFLGEGGFARVYEIINTDGARKAVKVVHKASIKSSKSKTKLWAEIKLHQMLDHPNIVRFEDVFEDDENVYMMLELCEHGSLMDLLRKRKRYTEPEARFILVQLIGACHYMHQTNVIHRDLKLGNVFLDGNLNVKVGDLGLAALIEKPGDRKKTICGTPNYIAPEVLFDTANGHSFEVDIWSVGVILYTLLIGKPPFQTKDVKAIYKRIRENKYDFPPDKEISEAARDLVTTILNPDPQKRPTLETIIAHPFFYDGPFPPYLPLTSLDEAPSFAKLTSTQSKRYFEGAISRARIGVTSSINVDRVRAKAGLASAALGPSIVKQEQDFRNAVQPDSPISALLTSARQPLVQASAQIKEPSLLRKLSAAGAQATLSPARKAMANATAQAHAGPSSGGRGRMEKLEEDEGETDAPAMAADQLNRRSYEAGLRERALEKQKARIVSQMAATAIAPGAAERTSPRKPLAPASTIPQQSDHRRVAHMDELAGAKTRDGKARVGLFESFCRVLDGALQMSQTPEGFKSPHPAPPKVFVVSWLDYCAKYGMGFAMADGTITVHFNDSSSIVLAPGKEHFDYVKPAASASGDPLEGMRKNYSISAYPRDLGNKVYLLNHFEAYIMKKLFKDPMDFTYQDLATTKGMVFVTRYLRMKHVIVFRLSNDVLQFNFYDHVKLILSYEGLVVSWIDRHHVLRTQSLEHLLRDEPDLSPRDQRRKENIVHKIQYARDVLHKIRTHAPTSTSSASAKAEMGTLDKVANAQSNGHREAVRPIR